MISEELTTRTDRLLERLRKPAGFRDPHRSLDNLATFPLLIVDDFGIRKPLLTAAEDLEIIMRRYERASTLFDIESSGGRLGRGAR